MRHINVQNNRHSNNIWKLITRRTWDEAYVTKSISRNEN